MNEQLDNALATLINKSLVSFQTGVDFLSAEIPDVIHQLLMWKFIYSLTMSTLSIFVLLFFLYLDYLAFKKVKESKNIDTLLIGWGVIGTIIRAVVYCVPLSFMSLDWLEIWVAPKVYLIEYAAQLVSSK